MAPNTAMFSKYAANIGAGRFAALCEPDHHHDDEADQRASDQRDIRRLVLAVGDGQEMREIARARLSE